MISRTFRIADAALAIKTSLGVGNATKVFISNTLGPVSSERARRCGGVPNVR